MKNQPFKNFAIGTLLVFFLCVATHAFGQFKIANSSATLKSSGYAPVNGLKIYYEIHGEGNPLVVLHGSYMNIDMNWGYIMPGLAKNNKVIAIEMQGHGRTADRAGQILYESLANDVAGLLNHLKIDSADVLGYSLGGTVAYQLALLHPQRVKKLVIISSVFKHDGWIQAARDIFPTITPEMFENTPLKTEYDRLAPDKTHWRDFVAKMTKFDSTPFDLGADNIERINSPVLIISGDNDGVDLAHITEMYRLAGGGVFGDMAGLPKSQLAIIPAMTHVTLMMQTENLLSYITPFLKPKQQNVKH